MANTKKDAQEKGGRANTSFKLSKEMKADIEKMIDKRVSSIEKQLEKLKDKNSKGSISKTNNLKGNDRKTSGKTKVNKGKIDKPTQTKNKTTVKTKKKSNQHDEDSK